MAFNRLGCMGHYYSGMLDIYSDLTQQYRFFGGHIELIEVDELAALRREVTDEEIRIEERERQRKAEDHDEDVDHPFLGVNRADLHHFLAVLDGGRLR